jgi:hypothetical protein
MLNKRSILTIVFIVIAVAFLSWYFYNYSVAQDTARFVIGSFQYNFNEAKSTMSLTMLDFLVLYAQEQNDTTDETMINLLLLEEIRC